MTLRWPARPAGSRAGAPERGKATPYLELPAPEWPDGATRAARSTRSPSARSRTTRCLPTNALRRLYEWEPLVAFVAACLGKERLVRYADPLGALNVAVMEDGDELEWHFDQTDFVVSLALQNAEAAATSSTRRASGAPKTSATARSRGCWRATRRRSTGSRCGPGRCSSSKGATRCTASPRFGVRRRGSSALLAYDTKPGTCASPLLQQARYGRVVRPPGEAAEGPA